MAEQILIDPSRFSQFGPTAGSAFYFVTNPELVDSFRLVHDGDYEKVETVVLGPEDDFAKLLDTEISDPAHILVASPYRFFQSPDPEVLGERRKLMAMACNSTPTSLDSVRHFLGIMERTSAVEQDAFCDRFFTVAEDAEHLEYTNPVTGTRATLDHLRDGLVWNQQAGHLEWGEQQIVPSGEVSVLPLEITEFDETLHLPLEGEITLRGYPILHSGTPSFSRGDQARIHKALSAMEHHPITARVTAGQITELTAVEPGAAPAVDMLEQMFAVDSRYRTVWEIGHALNSNLEILPGNHAMNEVYGGPKGCVHWGLGLTPFTQYHLDIISPETVVTGGGTSQTLLGNPAAVTT
ncbi:hypothetical protein AB0I77_46375 [Streptomyces sp. NPDC050619]|uniref:hypothetical protein n=1 Tax=Streptomyces sp. NPDC050619 TaxID=3157214 RepID=UPI003416A889